MRRPRAITRAVAAVRGRPRAAIGVGVVGALAGLALGWWAIRMLSADEEATPWLVVDTRPAPRPTQPVSFADGCLTSRCHTGLAETPAVHAPIEHGSCDGCHAPDAGDHTYPLVREKDRLCTSCHDTAGHQKFQHRAMTGDGCLACHSPHGSSGRGLLVADSTEATCGKCHPRAEQSVEHAPYKGGRCDACHDPHGEDDPFLLLGDAQSEHCGRCHAPVVQTVNSGEHRDLKGSCLACHAPHAAGHKGLLVAQPRDLCTSCHPAVGTTVAGAVVSHDPVLKGDQCVTCHDPHASPLPQMLRHTKAETCLSCHKDPVRAADGREIPGMAAALAAAPVVHGAVSAGDCSACHNMHGSGNARLLRETSARVLVGAYDVRNYALCFSCHDPNLAGGSGATLFRDGDRNLHEAHLRSENRTRSCAACHAVHAGDLPRLIAQTVNFEGSGWAMPMGFTLTETGGRCAPGCHQPLEYSRRPGGARAPNAGGAK